MTALENLPAHYYIDPAVYEAERQAVFRRTWQLLGPASQVAEPGAYLAVEMAGWKLFVLRGRDGVLRAFHNVCRHRGAPLLAEGQGRCDLLRCPYHLWLYDQEGRLRKAPWFGEDPTFRTEDFALEPVALDTWRGLLFVAIEPETPLLTQLGALPAEVADKPMEDFAAVAEERFVIACNWKLYTDNFVEGYHVPGIHPAFRKQIEFETFETVAHDGLVRMTARLKEGYFYGGKWMWAWPNWTLSVYGDGKQVRDILHVDDAVAARIVGADDSVVQVARGARGHERHRDEAVAFGGRHLEREPQHVAHREQGDHDEELARPGKPIEKAERGARVERVRQLEQRVDHRDRLARRLEVVPRPRLGPQIGAEPHDEDERSEHESRLTGRLVLLGVGHLRSCR